MKKDPVATAHALAIVSGILYILCALWTVVSRSSFMGVMSTWTHSIDLSRLPSQPPSFGSLVVGFVTFVVVAWLTGYAFAIVYNYFVKK